MEDKLNNEKEVKIIGVPNAEEILSPITTFELGGSEFPINEDDEVI